jgi:drug/metabolite transporter (DMT)-like permease
MTGGPAARRRDEGRTMTGQLRMGPAEWGMLLLLSVVWGGSFFFVEIILEELPALVLVAARVSLAAVGLWVVVLVLGLKLPRSRAHWVVLVVMGAFNSVAPFTLLAWAQGSLTSGLAAVLNATTPLWGVLFAQFMTRDERATPARIGGVLVGLAGVAVIMGASALEQGADAAGALPPLACVGAAVLYGFTGVLGRRLGGLPPMVTAAGQMTTASIIAWPLALLVNPPSSLGWPSGHVIAAVLGLALVSSAFAYVLYFRIMRTAGSTNVLLVTQLVPVTAILLGYLFLDEPLQLRTFAGMALIACGFALVDGRVLRLFRRPR